MVSLGSIFPNFLAKTTIGEIQFHEWLQDSWGMLFSYPVDFTPVCTTELARVVQLQNEFSKRNVKLIALSCDNVDIHNKWCNDIKAYAACFGDKFPYPIIADENRDIAVRLQIIDPDAKDANGVVVSGRAVFIVDPNKKLRLSILYPSSTGRNFDEILRVLDSLQLCDKYKVGTPADWKVGEEVLIQPNVSKKDANNLFPAAAVVTLPSGKEYVRKVPQPK